MTRNKLRLAIVGAGPAGIYAADILLKAERNFDVSIDLFDHLPAPYGLVRYGVAPDHPRIKGIINALREVLDRGDIRIFGNVRYGEDITLDDLKKHYNAVIFATGAVRDASLNVPGHDLDGSYGAAEFVAWFDGHPDFPRTWPLDAREIAVIGNGNVALDVSRMLAKHVEDLMPTEIPANVAAGLEASPVTDVHIFGRRGPTSVKFTPLELRELGELRDVDMILYDEDFDYDDAARAAVSGNKQVFVIDKVLNQWRQREVGQASRRLHLHFFAKPLEILSDGNGRVGGIRWERTAPDGEGGVVGTGEIRELPVQAVYRAVGYFGSPLPGIPFDKKFGVIPNHEGQVLMRDKETGDAAPDVRRLRDRLDQARPRRPHRPHQERRDGDHQARHQRPRQLVAARVAVRGVGGRDARVARHPLHRPRRLAPPRRARAGARLGRGARAREGRAARRDGRHLGRRGVGSRSVE